MATLSFLLIGNPFRNPAEISLILFAPSIPLLLNKSKTFGSFPGKLARQNRLVGDDVLSEDRALAGPLWIG